MPDDNTGAGAMTSDRRAAARPSASTRIPRRLRDGRHRFRPPAPGVRRHPADQPRLRADGARAALRRERDGDRDLSAGEGLRQAAGAAARGAGRALPAVGAVVPRGQRHRRPSPIWPAAGWACAPTAKRPAFGCAASWPTSMASGPSGTLGHVRGCACRRVPRPALGRAGTAGQGPAGMLREGELDAVIVGNDVPDDPTLRTVFPDPEASAEAFWRAHGSCRSTTW